MDLSNVLRVPVVLLLSAVSLFARTSDPSKSGEISKTATNDDYRAFTINNIFNYYSNNGDGSYNTYTSNGALEFPKGGFKTVQFEDGIVWGGFHKGYSEPKAGGSVYRHALQAGPILTVGTPTSDPVAADPLDPAYRVYRVRPDVGPKSDLTTIQGSLEAEMTLLNRYESNSVQSLFDSYIKDWNEWPARSATNPAGIAPFRDVDSNGFYDPNIDIPGWPGADQTLYYVGNDLNPQRAQNLMGCPPIGLEVHRTFWGYNRPGKTGNLLFSSTLIINKSGAPVDSMFLVQFSDPDVGDAGDDFVGCDVARNLGYAYNGRGTDAAYGVAVPSPGFRLLQGPMVPGAPTDSATFRQQIRKGYRNLPMTTFVFFSSGFADYRDPAQGIGGNLDWYRLMNGLTTRGGVPIINPLTNQASKFVFDGDPVTGDGWIDGMGGLTPQDRRFCMVTGPFTMADGDTQELLVANVVDVGADRLSSISMMKSTSDQAQNIYNNHLEAANPPPVHFTVSGLDHGVVLDWGDPADYTKIEASWGGGYQFQGYNVYQLSGPSFESDKVVRIATYDVKDNLGTIFDETFDDETGYMKYAAVQFGNNTGIIRSYDAETNRLNGQKLVNGTTYYYAVTAYAVSTNPLARPRQVETPPQVLAVIPQNPPPGFRALSYGDTLRDVAHVSNTEGPLSDGNLTAIVVDPTKLTGATYKVVFDDEFPNQTWAIVRILAAQTDTLVKGLKDQTGTVETSPIIDGIQWQIVGAPNDFKRFLVTANARGPLNPPDMGTFAFNSTFFPTLDGNVPDGVNDRPSARQQASGAKWGICTGDGGSQNPSYSYFLSRTTRETTPGAGGNWPRIIPYDYEIRFTASGGKGKLTFTTGNPADVPFELWNIGVGTPDDPSDDYRMIPWINDINGDETFGPDKVDHSVSGGDNDPETDWFYWMEPGDKTPGHAGYDAWISSNYSDNQTGQEVMARIVLVNWNGGSVSATNFPNNLNAKLPETGTVFRILTTKPNRPSDEFIVHSPAYQYNATLAADDVSRVNVYPNPYFGYNPLETTKYQRFVTFTHLPRRAVLRVFDLGGTLVRTLVKDDPAQFLQWDLENENHYMVGSAMYIVYVQMPDLGKTKILKLGIVQEQQWLDRW